MKNETALEEFNKIEQDCGELHSENAIERLRFFCSLAMNSRDWIDVEPFFDAVIKEQSKEK